MSTYSEMKDQFGDKTKAYLNYGFVTLLDVMGSDKVIEESARMSYGKGTRTVSDTRNLIRYLMRHKHTSPFEMGVVRLHVKMPIFIARQFIRHRTFSLNELSARYSEIPYEMYVPELSRMESQSQTNKQGSSGVLIDDALEMHSLIDSANMQAYDDYLTLLGSDLTRELARGVLPLNTFTELVFKADMKNLMHFLALRMHPKAQKEIRYLAQAIYDLIKDTHEFDLTLEAFDDYAIKAVTLSRMERQILFDLMNEDVELNVRIIKRIQESTELSKREKDEFLEKLNCKDL